MCAIIYWSICADFEDDGEDESDGTWQQELQRRYAQEANFMAELQARHSGSPPENNQYASQSFPGHNNHQTLQNLQSYGQSYNGHSGREFQGQQQNFQINYGGNHITQNQPTFGVQVSFMKQKCHVV